MKEAVEAVEARERGGEAPAGQSGGAAAAVTEALIAAKKELQDALEQAKKEAQGYHERWLRAAADLENYRKRALREREDAEKFSNEKLLRDFLPVVDDLERAVAAIGAVEDETTAKLVEGVRMVQKKFLAQLERHGVATFEAEGKAFDPAQHEAVQQINAEQPPGQVVSQLQRGFMLHDRLLRPALVVVSMGPARA